MPSSRGVANDGISIVLVATLVGRSNAALKEGLLLHEGVIDGVYVGPIGDPVHMGNGGERQGVFKDIIEGLKQVLRDCSELELVNKLLRGVGSVPAAYEGKCALPSGKTV